MPISEFEIGEHLLTANGSLATVRSLNKRPQPQTVYNIEVDGEHVYGVGANGYLVHNDGCGTIRAGTQFAKLNGTWRVRSIGKNGGTVWKSLNPRNKAAWDKARRAYWKAKGRTDGLAPRRKVLVEFKDKSGNLARKEIWKEKNFITENPSSQDHRQSRWLEEGP